MAKEWKAPLGELTYLSFESPIGGLRLFERRGALVALELSPFGSPPQGAKRGNNPLLQSSQRQLEEYFRGQRQQFDLPLAPEGSQFQQAAWKVLCQIPYGQTIDYAEEARRMGRPGAQRAAGGANRRNPLPIIIPCHRVIRADGTLGGFASGDAWKRSLLELEGAAEGLK
ncbi:MAG: methylated-DNA--[protein]-cysteine S-methyltransferase [bacterium]|nr:methylated-DNA--[protein]-cysteine S-methyltransferase [bacterium]